MQAQMTISQDRGVSQDLTVLDARATARVGAGREGTTRTRHLRLLAGTDDREPQEQLIALDQRARPPAASGEASIRVLIAARQALVRASYRALLESDERIEVVGEAASGQQALTLATGSAPNTLATGAAPNTLATGSAPDVVLLDLALTGLDEPGTMAAIVSQLASARVAVVLIAARADDERVFTALRAGAVGVLSTDAEPAELIRVLLAIAGGQALFPAGVVRRLLAELPARSLNDGPSLGQLDELTSREREVVALVGMGLSNGEIAAHLVISPATAKTHVSRAMVKLHARDRAQLVVLAYEAGLVPARTDASRSSDQLNAIA